MDKKWGNLKRLSILLAIFSGILLAQTEPVVGLRTFIPRNYAFINGHVHTSPGSLIENGTILIRDGIVTAVGKNIKIPGTATVVDLKGKHVYAGFIDGYLAIDSDESLSGERENWNSQVKPAEFSLDHYKMDREDLDKRLSQGFTAAQLALNEGIFAGQTAVIQLNGEGTPLDESAAQAMAFRYNGWGSTEFPNALLGCITLMRQTFLDAEWYSDAKSKVEKYPGLNEPVDSDRHLETLSRSVSDRTPFLFQVSDEIYAMRAMKIAREFDLNLQLVGNGWEYRRLKDLKNSNAFIYLPVNYPGKPDVTDPYRSLEYSTAALKHWDIAPDNAQRADRAGILFGWTGNGLKDIIEFKKNLARSVERGLSPITALAALTTNPARAMGLDDILGKIEEGFLANLVITEDEYFNPDSRVTEVWVAGKREWEEKDWPDRVAGIYSLEYNGITGSLELKKDLSGTIMLDSVNINLQDLNIDQDWLSWNCILPDKEGITRFRAVFKDGQLVGSAITPFDEFVTWKATRMKEDDIPDSEDPELENPSELSVVFPEGAYGISAPPLQYDRILINDATIWTSGSRGILEAWDMLVEKGKITRIAPDISLSVRPDVVIEGKGKHVTPGIIDAHSHMAASSINEGTQSITSEVRIQDVINSDDITIYRQLAGGTTMANILHGSANTIGGQNAVIKLRWGGNPDDLIYTKAPPGIKFALGENVKQSNWGDDMTTRYPQTRMGVEQLFRDAFTRARDYKKIHAAYAGNSKWKKRKVAPRIDLELEALVEVMDGKRFVHCHSYRQDEILMLTRVAEDFGFQIKTFQHILEGYKVADRMADHGVGGSTFSDWWAYKFEVYDAIPYNAALMADVGVVVTFNSDDRDLGRRLNLEAAKGVKYGGMSEVEALKTVTLNAAIQLGIDKWTGSLEIGKDADFVIWNGSPLSSYTICEETWIDGRQYFSLEKDRILRNENKIIRNELIQKILAADHNGAEPMEPDQDKDQHYSCRDHTVTGNLEGGVK